MQQDPRPSPGSVLRRLPRPTIRLRLTLLYGALFLLSGAALLTLLYLLVGQATSMIVAYRSASGELGVTLQTQLGSPPQVVTGGGFGQLPGPDQLRILSSQYHDASMGQLLIWSGVALAIMAVLSVVIGWMVAGRVLRPLHDMAAEVREMSASSLDRRLALTGPRDELAELGGTFNDLLGRLQAAFDAQRQFVANASHELRTPLARQRTVLQVAISDPDATVDSLRAAAERAVVAGRQQERLIEALLTLARGERGLEGRDSVDLGALAADAVNARREQVGARDLHLDLRLAATTVIGDPWLLEQLAGNLVDNAIRYNRRGGQLAVTTAADDGASVLTVTNDGEPLEPSQVARLFEPFERLGGARTDHGDGWGLGLSIVRAIAAAHGATLTARARPVGGLQVDVRFPPANMPSTGDADTATG